MLRYWKLLYDIIRRFPALLFMSEIRWVRLIFFKFKINDQTPSLEL